MPEVWKKIDWIDDLNGEYEVSSMGRVRRLGQIHYTFQGKKYINKVLYLKPSLATTGYYTVNLYPNGKLKHFYVHRLVATAFIQNNNPENDFINHMNEIKTDNRVENLEWCNRIDNLYDSYTTLSATRNFKECVLIKESDNSIIGTFQSIKAAAEYANEKFNCSISGMRKNHKSGGYRLEFNKV